MRWPSRFEWAREHCRPAFRPLIRGLVCIHFVLIAAAITHNTDRWLYNGWWARPLVYWSSVNFSIWRFAFFSPDVGKSRTVDIRIRTPNYAQSFRTSEGFDFFTSNRESLNRFYGFRTELCQGGALQDLGARSAVVRMLNELGITGPAEATFAVTSVRFPTMAGYRAHEPVKETEVFSADFAFQPPSSSEPPAESR